MEKIVKKLKKIGKKRWRNTKKKLEKLKKNLEKILKKIEKVKYIKNGPKKKLTRGVNFEEDIFNYNHLQSNDNPPIIVPYSLKKNVTKYVMDAGVSFDTPEKPSFRKIIDGINKFLLLIIHLFISKPYKLYIRKKQNYIKPYLLVV